MNFDFNDTQPLFIQIAKQIEDGIGSGYYQEGSQIPSTTEVSKTFQINPATVLKGMNLLVDKGLVEKRRGLGMFVTTGAQEKVQVEKKDLFLNQELDKLIQEAKKLNISLEQLIKDIERRY